MRESLSLRFLYNTFLGRIMLKLLSAPALSRAVGSFLDSSASRILIKRFIRKNKIDMSEYEKTDYDCFNSFFTRRVLPELRYFSDDEYAFCSPCDGLLSVYEIDKNTVIPAKMSKYTVDELLAYDNRAQSFYGGTALVFRLCVNHYHRYAYAATGESSESVFIQGVLHTVRPIALARYPVFTRNSREYTFIDSDIFGKVCQIEVGAMLVGKIKNNNVSGGKVRRGEEKGMFLYGGSTIIVLLEKGMAKINDEYTARTSDGLETPVKMGQRLDLPVSLLS